MNDSMRDYIFPCKECILLNNCSRPCPSIHKLKNDKMLVTSTIINYHVCPACGHDECNVSSQGILVTCTNCEIVYAIKASNPYNDNPDAEILIHSFRPKNLSAKIKDPSIIIHTHQADTIPRSWKYVIQTCFIPILEKNMKHVNKQIDKLTDTKTFLQNKINECHKKF